MSISASSSVETLQTAPERTELAVADVGVPVFVIGDVAINWLAANWRHEKRHHEGWRNEPQIEMLAMLGGAWLMDSFLLQLSDLNPHRYYCYKRPLPPAIEGDSPRAIEQGLRRTADPHDYLHTFTELDIFERGNDDTCAFVCRNKCQGPCNKTPGTPDIRPSEKVYRIKTSARYWGPDIGDPRKKPLPADLVARTRSNGKTQEVSPTSSTEDKKNPRVLVIFDEGQGFCNQTERWDELLPSTGSADPNLYIVLYHRAREHGYINERSSSLWERISTHYAQQTTVVVSADALRESGVDISKDLSLERTAQDFDRELEKAPFLKELARCSHLLTAAQIAQPIQ